MRTGGKSVIQLILLFFGIVLAIWCITYLAHSDHYTTKTQYVEYSCRPDVGRCFYGGKVCFKYGIETENFVVLWGMYFCHNGTEVKMTCKPPKYYMIYFTGIGCPHCALTDPFLFYGVLEWNGKKYMFEKKEESVIIEYELYREGKYNYKVFNKYLSTFFSPEEARYVMGVPHIYVVGYGAIVGDLPILNKLNKVLRVSNFSFDGFNIWQGKPKIWYCDRVLIIKTSDYKPPQQVIEEFLKPNWNPRKLLKYS